MEEVIAKSVRTLYIVTYAVCLGISLLVLIIGAGFVAMIDEQEAVIFGAVFIVLGVLLAGASVGWLVYFIKMPKEAIKLKDGKLYFRNGTVCSPTEVDNCTVKTMGLDGAMFNFGKLMITVNGKQFKLKFVDQASTVPNKLFMLKAEYSVKEHIAKQQDTVEESAVPAEDNVQQDVTVPEEVTVPAEENTRQEVNTEENNG